MDNKILVLIEVAESPTDWTLRQIEEQIRLVLRGHTVERVDVEGVDGVTQVSILADVMA